MTGTEARKNFSKFFKYHLTFDILRSILDAVERTLGPITVIVNYRKEQEMQWEEFNRLAQAHMQQIRAMQQSGDQQGLMALQNELVEQVNAKFANDSTAGLPKEIIDTYAKIGGTPFLDRNYTVFGEVVSGMDVVEKIEKAETDAGDRPVKDIRIISMSIIDKK